MAKKNKIKNWVIPGVVGGGVIILTVASIVSGSIQQKKEKERQCGECQRRPD